MENVLLFFNFHSIYPFPDAFGAVISQTNPGTQV